MKPIKPMGLKEPLSNRQIFIGFFWCTMGIIALYLISSDFNLFEKKLVNISYGEIMAPIREKKIKYTDAQLKEHFNAFIGKKISWRGWVFEVKKKNNGFQIWVDMDAPGSGFSIQDIYLNTKDKKALALKQKQKLSFVGEIDKFDKIFGKYLVTVNASKID